MEKPCKECDRIFQFNLARDNTAKFCSVPCHSIFQRKSPYKRITTNAGKTWYNKTPVYKECESIFQTYPYLKDRARFCSKDCRIAGSCGAIPWNKGKKGVMPKGEDHHAWKGGVSRDKHVGQEYKDWRAAVFTRDDWTCQTCHARSGAGQTVYLEAHHIKSWSQFPELRYEIENGMTLCRECHTLTDNYKNKKS